MTATLLFTAIGIGAPALKDRPKEHDIVGEWIVDSVQTVGKARPPGKGEMRYVFAADGKWRVYRGERLVGGEDRGFNTNPKTNPPTIDLILDTTEQEPPTQLGIYKIEGDTLKLRINRTGTRPTSFEVSSDLPGTLYIMKRVKPKD
jgi:uncharacterized protein (TIGR03067 family)